MSTSLRMSLMPSPRLSSAPRAASAVSKKLMPRSRHWRIIASRSAGSFGSPPMPMTGMSRSVEPSLRYFIAITPVVESLVSGCHRGGATQRRNELPGGLTQDQFEIGRLQEREPRARIVNKVLVLHVARGNVGAVVGAPHQVIGAK